MEGRRDDLQAAHAAAAGRSAHARVRDYYLGMTATLSRIIGDTPEPPVLQVLTDPR